MYLEDLVVQVKEELRQMGRFDMRTFAYVHFDYQRSRTVDLVEFFIYEKPSQPHHNYVHLTYDRLSGERMYTMEIPTSTSKRVQKIVLGVETKKKSALKVVSV
ncbi:hypothetical protein VNN36_07750 [Lactococcus garvieae]|uniref:hypothetical protein n=1 Tax=Lactococcus garvieae TaxID=1363 RepID=UPI0030CA9304